jgi:iron(III) transport system substrate-binding protein
VSSVELMAAIEDEEQPFDVALSSAMDLQTKLANDGFALTHKSAATADLPDWGKWRDALFAFTQEPAAIVLSRAAFEGLPLPATRQDLIAILREYPDRFDGKVGTYDVRSSGLGYLFATQDARTSETYWRLSEVMGGLNARLYCCSSDMIDDVASGSLAVAYNVLGSYAEARDDQDKFHVILPSDFTSVMMRTAIIPRFAKNPDLAGHFIDHLIITSQTESDRQNIPGSGVSEATRLDEASLRRIRMGPGLLVYLDQLKKRGFIREWESAIVQP